MTLSRAIAYNQRNQCFNSYSGIKVTLPGLRNFAEIVLVGESILSRISSLLLFVPLDSNEWLL